MSHSIDKRRLLSLSLILLVAAFFLPSRMVPSAHAQNTGLVCITGSPNASSCDASPPTLGPITAGYNFQVGVFIQDSDAMNGFDIYVRSDSAYVRPVGASLGNLIANPSLTSLCIENRTTVNCTPGEANGPGVVQVAVTESSGSNECGGVSPCSGMAFTIFYQANDVAPSSNTPLSYPTDPGCSTSSVSSPPDTCVLVTNAFGTALAENIQGATVTLEPQPFVGLVCVTYPSTETSCPSTPAVIGPVTMGSTFTVGLFIQGSNAMGGFDIYVRSDPAYVRPVNASLGSLITSPFLTSICVNNSSQTGDCTVNSANGPGVVEVTTIDGSGGNECGGIGPCSGMAFTITYEVVGATNSTTLDYPTHPRCAQSSVFSPPNTCVLVATTFGDTLAENIQGATVTQNVHQKFTGLLCVTYPSTETSCPSTPATIGPVSMGSSFTVGIFVQNSEPLGGWDVYVAVDPAFLNPTSAALGNLIANPTFTTICINGLAMTGSCTQGTVNGPGVVEVTTIESSGLPDCNNPPGPCSGLAFTITYKVAGPNSSTTLYYPSAPGCVPSSVNSSDVCVLISDNVGTPLPENIQGGTVIQLVRPTTTSVDCTPQSIVLGTSTSCTATVTVNDNETNPTGTATFTANGPGNFNPSPTCNLSGLGTDQAHCSVFYTPARTGSQTVTAVYSGDSTHSGSTSTTFQVTISPAPSDFRLTSNSTSLSVPTGGMGTVMFTVTGLGGFTGSVTLTSGSLPPGVTVMFVPDPVIISAVGGTDTSNMTVFVGSSVPAGTLFSFEASGSGGNRTHTIQINVNVTTAANPTFAQGGLKWTHHLSLGKSSAQTWTAIVANPSMTSVRVLVRIVGHSGTNPSLTFDVICGVTCVNNAGGVNNTPGLTPVTVPSGAKSFSFSFNQPISSSFVNEKVNFTASLYWTNGNLYIVGGTNSGSFAVVP